MELKEDKNFIYDIPIKKNFKYYYRENFLLKLKDIFIIILLKIYSKKKNLNKKYYVSICAIFKDEAIYLKEWIEYHLMIGIEHFYLYNNFSTDNYKEILKPYIEKGIITLKEWPVNQGQLSAYQDCYEKNKEESQWIGFLDIDEFVCPYKVNDIKEWLKKYELFPSIIIYWKMFGTSGKIYREKKLLIEEFYISYEKLLNIGKYFFNTDFKMREPGVHTIVSEIKILGKKFKIYPINENKKYLQYGIHRKGKKDFTIQINHYFSKTYNEYTQKKMIRGDVYHKIAPYTLEYFYNSEIKNISADFKIFRFIVKLKKILEIEK